MEGMCELFHTGDVFWPSSGEPPREGPMVRIRLPPALSLQRTMDAGLVTPTSVIWRATLRICSAISLCRALDAKASSALPHQGAPFATVCQRPLRPAPMNSTIIAAPISGIFQRSHPDSATQAIARYVGRHRYLCFRCRRQFFSMFQKTRVFALSTPEMFFRHRKGCLSWPSGT